MALFKCQMDELKSQLQNGAIQPAYRGLIDFILGLKARIQKKHPEYSLPGGIYAGFLDMTYFAIVTEDLKKHNLKIAVVFNYSAFRFEAWLSAVNRKVQADFREHLLAQGWDEYPLADPQENPDALIERVLVDEPDFGSLEELADSIEQRVIDFIRDMEELVEHS